MKPSADRIKLTYDDFLLFPEDGKRHELIDGEHYVTPSPNTTPMRVSGNCIFSTDLGSKQQPIDLSVLRSIRRRRSPALMSVEPDLRMSRTNAWAETNRLNTSLALRTVVVEIGSPGTRKRDETIKRRLYERSGVSDIG